MQLASFFSRILDALLPLRDTARIVRDASIERVGALVEPSVVAENTIALLPYRHSLIRALVIEAKFNRSREAFSLLGTVLAEYLAARAEDTEALAPTSVMLVPVPLGEARRRERGYNQVEEVARAAGISFEPLLRRTRETKPQTSLPRRERLRNMEGAFEVVGTIDPARTYIVIDDVTTTGATLAAAAAALRAAGAEGVSALALAH